MKVKISSILVVVAIVLVLVLTGGLIVRLFSDVFLLPPTSEVEKYVTAEALGPDDSMVTVVLDAVVKISGVEEATKYEIYVNEEFVGSTTNNEFSILDIAPTNVIWYRSFEVCVIAVRETDKGQTVSDISNVLTFEPFSAG